MNGVRITRVDEERWQDAQAFEWRFAQDAVHLGDDYNNWWCSVFDNYQLLRGKSFPQVLEVGCGPHTNVRLILPQIEFQELWLEDPLILRYQQLARTVRRYRFLKHRAPVAVATLVKKHRASLLSEPLEELPLADRSIDLCVCINVLDHVRDADSCFQQMRRILRRDGVLVLGQDLSNEEDTRLCPESWTDVGHPVKMDAEYLDQQLRGFVPLDKKILPREQGRNPRCHYGTYLFIGQRPRVP